MDKDEFQAWKDSLITKWVIRELSLLTDQWTVDCKDRLFSQSTRPDWVHQQAEAAYLKGLCEGVNYLKEMEYQDIEQDISQND